MLLLEKEWFHVVTITDTIDKDNIVLINFVQSAPSLAYRRPFLATISHPMPALHCSGVLR
jgi:hypothetical protein